RVLPRARRPTGPVRRPGRRRARRVARSTGRRADGSRGPAADAGGSARRGAEAPVRLVAVHARTMTLELARQPSYVVPTLLFPAVFFLFFGAPAAAGGAEARLATFAGFAVIGVAFFQFGVGIAAERASPWEAYVRTLPVGACARLVARILSAGAFAAVAAGAVVATAVATTSASLAASSWLELAAALGAGGVPFAALGVAIGYWAPPRGALPIANLLYLALSY